MIVCTKYSEGIVRNAFGKANAAVSNIEDIIAQLSIDPKVSSPAKEAFIIATEDIRNPRIKQKFESVIGSKHPDVCLIVIARDSKSAIVEGNGINKVLVKPKPSDLKNAIQGIVKNLTERKIVLKDEEASKPIEAWKPYEAAIELEPEPTPVVETPVEPEKPVELLPIDTSPVVEEEKEKPEEVSVDTELNIAKRIKECEKVADAHRLVQEINATAVVREMLKENQTYATIEDKLRGYQEKICAIMNDRSIVSYEERLNKVRALILDRNYYRAHNDTIIEQTVEEIIELLTSHSLELLNARLRQLDAALAKVGVGEITDADLPKLVGLKNDRANVILELVTLSQEMQNIYAMTNDLAQDTVAILSNASAQLTGNDEADVRLRALGATNMAKGTLDAIENVLKSANQASVEFDRALIDLKAMRSKCFSLLGFDSEVIAMQNQIINFLLNHHVEDTIIAETLLKKSMRVFVGEEGTGVTATTLVLSERKSRQNANVLCIDLSGKTKYEDYDESPISLDDFIQNRYEKEFCLVAGALPDTAEAAQQILVTLTKAADYYRVINVIVSPEQREVLSITAPDVLCINYIVDTDKKKLDRLKSFIAETTFENVAQRVIINKCDISVSLVIDLLNIGDNANMSVSRIEEIPELRECSYRKIKPYLVERVVEGYAEVMKHA